jgi:hypothetical protein
MSHGSVVRAWPSREHGTRPGQRLPRPG